MKIFEWLFGTDDQADELRARVAELEDQVDQLTRTNRQLIASFDVQWKLIRALRDCNANLDSRLLEANR